MIFTKSLQLNARLYHSFDFIQFAFFLYILIHYSFMFLLSLKIIEMFDYLIHLCINTNLCFYTIMIVKRFTTLIESKTHHFEISLRNTITTFHFFKYYLRHIFMVKSKDSLTNIEFKQIITSQWFNCLTFD